MKEEIIVVTALRLLGILTVLNKHDASKTDFAEYFQSVLKISSVSKETLKLDINTLIKGGFKINRGTPSNGHKFILEEKYNKFALTETDYAVLAAIKHAALGMMEVREILNLQSFYKNLCEFFPTEKMEYLADFNFFNILNKEIVNDIYTALENKSNCIVYYYSYGKGHQGIKIFPEKITVKNEKVYLYGFSFEHGKNINIRLDNIKWIKQAEKTDESLIKKDDKIFRYTISKSFYEDFPLEEYENPIKVGKNYVTIEAIEDDFFMVQRIITMGQNCKKIESEKIKNQITDTLEKTLRKYV